MKDTLGHEHIQSGTIIWKH